jgi:serine/threonine protein kinase
MDASTPPNGAGEADEPDGLDGLLAAWFRSSTGTPFDGDPQHDDFGNYRLLQPLGEGGMGRVYLAEQTAPVRRQVALKILRAELGSTESLARFRAEQQALARMNHDNIARVFDAGESRAGRPFFVMERIVGRPLRAYCDNKNLSVRDRLRLMLDVCAGVQHAHDNGVLHRDLKPSNVLVTEQSERATPKIIDFGLARTLDLPPGERAAWSRSGAVFGTPSHMSPEQANGVATLGPATDVYALGVMLFELLTGSLPLANLDQDTPANAQRRIGTEEPPPPSTRLTQLPDAAAIARARGTSVDALRAELAGPLDWIVLRALQKEPERRYASAAALAADVQNFLADVPVTARPDAWSTRWRKWCNRHPDLHRGLWLGALVGCAAMLLLLPLLRPARAADTAPNLSDQMPEEPAGADAATGLGFREVPTDAQRNALELALAQHRRRTETGRDNPAVAAEVALAQLEIGDAQRRLGRRAEAGPTLRSAITAFDALLARSGASASLRGHRGRARDSLSRIARDGGDLRQSLDDARAASADLLTAMASDGGASFQRPLAYANGHLLEVLCELNEFDEALALADDQLRLLATLSGNPGERAFPALALQAYYGRALALNGLRRYEEAKAAVESGLAVVDAERTFGIDRETKLRQAVALRLLSRFEQRFADNQDRGPAGDYARRAIAIYEQLAAESPADADARIGIANTVYFLAEFRRHAKDLDGALVQYAAAEAAARQALHIDPDNRRGANWLGYIAISAAGVHLDRNDHQAALAMARALQTAGGASWASARILSSVNAVQRQLPGADPRVADALDEEALGLLRTWVPTAWNGTHELIRTGNYPTLRKRADFNALVQPPTDWFDDREAPASIAARWVSDQSGDQLAQLVDAGWRIVDFELESEDPLRFSAALVATNDVPRRAVRWLPDTDQAGVRAGGWPNTHMGTAYAPFRNGRYACVLAPVSEAGKLWYPNQTIDELLASCEKHLARPWSITAVGNPKERRLGSTCIGNHQWVFRNWRITTAAAPEIAGHIGEGWALGDLVRWPDDTITCVETQEPIAGQRLLIGETSLAVAAAVADGSFRVTTFCTYQRRGQRLYDAVLRPNR